MYKNHNYNYVTLPSYAKILTNRCVRIFNAKFGVCKTIQFWARISTPAGGMSEIIKRMRRGPEILK